MKKNKTLLSPKYSLVPLVFAATSLIVLHFYFPLIIIINPPYNNLGVALILLGGTFGTWSVYILRKYNTTIVSFLLPSSLVTRGPYSFSRNPMYLGFGFLSLGLAIYLGSATAFLIPLLVFVVLNSLFIPYEENNLEGKFGNKYTQYKKKVKKWM